MTLNRIDPSVLARTNVVERFKDTQRQDGSRDKTGNNESGNSVSLQALSD